MKSTKSTSGGQKEGRERATHLLWTLCANTLLASVHTRAEAARGTTVLLPTLGSVYVCEAFFCVSYKLLLTTLLKLLAKNEVNRLVYKMTITHETQ